MEIEIRENLKLHLFGFSGPVPGTKYGETGIALSDRMWDIVNEHKLPHKGVNIWMYDSQSIMYAGVEMERRPSETFGLEERVVSLKKYAWHKHIGAYSKLYEANALMRDELSRRGIKYGPPSFEIYGHHGPDENKLETEIIYTIY